MNKHREMMIDLNRVDWLETGDGVASIIATINQNRRRFEREAAQRRVDLGDLMAAAITEMIREHLATQCVKEAGSDIDGSTCAEK